MAALLSVKEATIAFGGLKAVDNVSLDVHEGETLGIVGPNGAGKTTLLNGINCLVPLATGCVELNGERVDGRLPHTVAAMGIARTFQNPQYFRGFECSDYVKLGLSHVYHDGVLRSALRTPGSRRRETEQDRRALLSLQLLGLEHFASVRLEELPYGIQRLVDVARAIVASPKLLLLDEPTSGTVRAERDHVKGVLAELKSAGMTVLLIDHDVSFVGSSCDRVVVLGSGQVIGMGYPDDVLNRPIVRELYYGSTAPS